MQSVTASEIKKNSTILQNALKGDMLVTKRDKPFVVILDYERYLKLISNHKEEQNQDWIEESFGSMSKEDAKNLLDEIYSSRVNKEINL
jgi:hypothetical protein